MPPGLAAKLVCPVLSRCSGAVRDKRRRPGFALEVHRGGPRAVAARAAVMLANRRADRTTPFLALAAVGPGIFSGYRLPVLQGEKENAAHRGRRKSCESPTAHRRGPPELPPANATLPQILALRAVCATIFSDAGRRGSGLQA